SGAGFATESGVRKPTKVVKTALVGGRKPARRAGVYAAGKGAAFDHTNLLARFGARAEFVEPGHDHPAGTAARQCRRRAGHRQPALWHRMRLARRLTCPASPLAGLQAN